MLVSEDELTPEDSIEVRHGDDLYNLTPLKEPSLVAQAGGVSWPTFCPLERYKSVV